MKIKDLILKTEKVNWQELEDLQPINLKNNYHSEKTKQSIIKNGFARAIYVWEDSKGSKKIIDGHCRKDLLIELKNDGYEVPEKLNCTFLDLPNKKAAVKYLLQVFNQKTNPINESNMGLWLDDIKINLDDIEINLDELHIDITESIEIQETALSEQSAGNEQGKHILQIECESEAEQEILYNRFLQEKLKVKIIN
jgi:hypothetical protein